jgi:integral membrane protein
MLKTALGRFRTIAFLEGMSFLILLFIAMPLKHFAGMPEYVKFVGWAHGLLFVLYILALIMAAGEYGWSIVKIVIAFVASLIPFGTFWLDLRLKKEQESNPA